MRNSQHSLLEDIERFLKASKLSATAFGEQVMNDRHLVKRLRQGGSVTLKTADKIRSFIADEMPRSKKKGRRAARPNELRVA
jgi:hypothetical protein